MDAAASLALPLATSEMREEAVVDEFVSTGDVASTDEIAHAKASAEALTGSAAHQLREVTYTEQVAETVSDDAAEELPEDTPAKAQALLNEEQWKKEQKVDKPVAHVKPMSETASTDRADTFTAEKPRTDFAKKAVIQPMKSEKLTVTQQTVAAR